MRLEGARDEPQDSATVIAKDSGRDSALDNIAGNQLAGLQCLALPRWPQCEDKRRSGPSEALERGAWRQLHLHRCPSRRPPRAQLPAPTRGPPGPTLLDRSKARLRPERSRTFRCGFAGVAAPGDRDLAICGEDHSLRGVERGEHRHRAMSTRTPSRRSTRAPFGHKSRSAAQTHLNRPQIAEIRIDLRRHSGRAETRFPPRVPALSP